MSRMRRAPHLTPTAGKKLEFSESANRQACGEKRTESYQAPNCSLLAVYPAPEEGIQRTVRHLGRFCPFWVRHYLRIARR